MQRREFLQSATALTTLAVAGAATVTAAKAQTADSAPHDAGATPPFTYETVQELANARAAESYTHRVSKLTGSFADLNYDQYRAIRFRRDRDPWADVDGFALDLLPPGLIFYEPVAIHLVDQGVARPMAFAPDMFDFDPALFPSIDLQTVGDMGWSGFRLRTRLNRPDVLDEFLVFQGASYFRAVARGTLYGLSARGLALSTASPKGEEFPIFTDFWIHHPEPGQDTVRIHALLDSRSVAGAYQFDVTPGAETRIETRVTLYPRRDLTEVGIAPLTSMFWFGPGDSSGIDDYRPAVHDSDGLQMLTGSDQRLWRALSGPSTLQMSAFQDQNPQGFGLVQRARDFAHYQDAEAHYDKRPSAWITPRENWGQGSVALVEIPVENEFNDNIVSFWRPRNPLKAGQAHSFNYRLDFCDLPPDLTPLANVVQTRSGRSINNKDTRSYIVDFDLSMFTDTLPEAEVTVSSGQVVHSYLKPLIPQGVLRLAFEYQPQGAAYADLKAVLKGPDGPLSETWVARWSK